jgi:energy-coupling factor transporter ATP-binding protein EcfA2
LTESSKLWLRSLTIHRYEQFRDCPRVEFSPDDNLILGVNGSGKTSLLRLLAAVLRWNYDALLGQPFDIEFEQVFDGVADTSVSIKGRVQNQPSLPAVKQQSPRRSGVRSKYDGFLAHFELRTRDSKIDVEVRDSVLRVAQDSDELGDGRPVESWLGYDIEAELRRSETLGLSWHCDAVFVVRENEFDFLQLTEEIPYHYLIPLDDDEMESLEPLDIPEHRQWDSLLRRLVGERAAGGADVQAYLLPRTCNLDDDDPNFDVNPVLQVLDAESMSYRLKIQKTQSMNDRIAFEGKGIEIRVRFPSGTEVIDSLLTFGQKRLLTIALGALFCGGSPLLVDEIDNGLHPGLLEKTLELIGGRQTFIASHNKLVIDLLNYENPEDMRRTIHVCRRHPDGTQHLIELSDEQVREVFEKVAVGIMNPSDVLLREGLW